MKTRFVESKIVRGQELVLEAHCEGEKGVYGQDMEYWGIRNNIPNQWGGYSLIRHGQKDYVKRLWKKMV